MTFHFAWGTPVRKRADRQQQLEELQREYRGIYWDTAADPNECTDEQFDILAETLRVVVNDVMPLAGTHLDRSASAAFNRSTTRSVFTPREPFTSTRSPRRTSFAAASAASSLVAK